MTQISTRNLHEHTAQQVFDFVVGRILEQGVASIIDGNNCLYRSPTGLKCAFGHLILEEDYPAVLGEDGGEIGSLNAFSERTIQKLGWKNEAHKDLVRDLQLAHDSAAAICGRFLEEFKRRCKNTADQHRLTWNFN